MSECVVRMEMPKDCPMCPMSHWNKLDELTGCEVAPGKLFEISRSKEYRESNTRPDWCPIICSLPEGHGRLGDLDELGRKINGARIRAMQDGQDTNPYWECGDIIASEQTIVPAEAERRET